MPTFHLQFDPSELDHWASRYSYADDGFITNEISPQVRKRGHYTRDEFLKVCGWKTGRSASKCRKNSAEFVEEATAAALSAKSEELRIGTLTLLNGVGWPTASVLLHFGSNDRYPILDFRALHALGLSEPTQYTFDFWGAYVVACRDLADEHDVSMRKLDRAMWQWSKEFRYVGEATIISSEHGNQS